MRNIRWKYKFETTKLKIIQPICSPTACDVSTTLPQNCSRVVAFSNCPPEKNEESRKKSFVADVGQNIEFARQGKPLRSLIYVVTDFFTLEEKQVSPETRARPRKPTVSCRGRVEKNRKLDFKANLFGHLYMRSHTSSHFKQSR